MFVDVKKMLPDEILKMISLLTAELSKKEKSKGIIDLEIHKEKGEICCPNCHSKNIKKNGKYKDRQLYKCKDLDLCQLFRHIFSNNIYLTVFKFIPISF